MTDPIIDRHFDWSQPVSPGGETEKSNFTDFSTALHFARKDDFLQNGSIQNPVKLYGYSITNPGAG